MLLSEEPNTFQIFLDLPNDITDILVSEPNLVLVGEELSEPKHMH